MNAPLWLTRVNRPLTRRNRSGAILAILTCPCHLGVAVILLSGTALGGWLAAERAWLYVVMTALFVAGLVVFFRPDPTCKRCEP